MYDSNSRLNRGPSLNSQSCESLFRDARSLTGAFLTQINFTVKDSLRSSQKLSILNQMKYNQLEKGLSFPIHHKRKREHLSTSSYQSDEIDTLNIEQIIGSTYDQAIKIVEHWRIFYTINQHSINILNDISEYIFNILKKNSRMIDYSLPATNYTTDEFGLDEENDDDINNIQDQSTDETLFECLDESDSDDDGVLNSTKSDFDGIRVVDRINPGLTQSYFKIKIKINQNIKYLHK